MRDILYSNHNIRTALKQAKCLAEPTYYNLSYMGHGVTQVHRWGSIPTHIQLPCPHTYPGSPTGRWKRSLRTALSCVTYDSEDTSAFFCLICLLDGVTPPLCCHQALPILPLLLGRNPWRELNINPLLSPNPGYIHRFSEWSRGSMLFGLK